MEPEPVETIVLSSERKVPPLTPDEADCLARIRARPRREPVHPESPRFRPGLWWLGLAVLLLVALSLLAARVQ